FEGLGLRPRPLGCARRVFPRQRHAVLPCSDPWRRRSRRAAPPRLASLHVENAGVPAAVPRASGPPLGDTPELSCIFDITADAGGSGSGCGGWGRGGGGGGGGGG